MTPQWFAINAALVWVEHVLDLWSTHRFLKVGCEEANPLGERLVYKSFSTAAAIKMIWASLILGVMWWWWATGVIKSPEFAFFTHHGVYGLTIFGNITEERKRSRDFLRQRERRESGQPLHRGFVHFATDKGRQRFWNDDVALRLRKQSLLWSRLSLEYAFYDYLTDEELILLEDAAVKASARIEKLNPIPKE